MNANKRRTRFTLLGLLLTVSSPLSYGCGIGHWSTGTTNAAASGLELRTESYSSGKHGASPSYAHPVEFSPEYLESFFASLRFVDNKLFRKDQRPPVFRPEIRRELVKALVRNGPTLNSNERVRFSVDSGDPDRLLKNRIFHTTGYLYVETTEPQAPRLHVVFETVHQSSMDHDMNHQPPLESAAPLALEGDSRFHVDESGHTNRLWVVGQMPADAVRVSPPITPGPGSESTSAEKSAVGSSSINPASNDAAPELTPAQETLIQLKTIEQLHDEGLLNQEQYEQKRRQLLGLPPSSSSVSPTDPDTNETVPLEPTLRASETPAPTTASPSPIR